MYKSYIHMYYISHRPHILSEKNMYVILIHVIVGFPCDFLRFFMASSIRRACGSPLDIAPLQHRRAGWHHPRMLWAPSSHGTIVFRLHVAKKWWISWIFPWRFLSSTYSICRHLLKPCSVWISIQNTWFANILNLISLNYKSLQRVDR